MNHELNINHIFFRNIENISTLQTELNVTLILYKRMMVYPFIVYQDVKMKAVECNMLEPVWNNDHIKVLWIEMCV